MKNITHRKEISHFFLFFVLVSLSLFSFCLSLVEAAEKVSVKDIRSWSSQGYTRVVVELSSPVEFTKNRLSNPDRLYFDLRHAKITREIKTRLPVGDGTLRVIRAGQFDGDTVRIVLDLETIENYKAFYLDDPNKLIIDVYAKRPAERVVLSRKVIVLDPGHGGHDSGAIGRNGLQEKDVVLDIALKVRELLAAEPNLEIVLTRETDVFIPLPERTAMAMKRDADLFVSIHANASPNRAARGIETYLLNWTNQEEAIRVSARENYISVRTMKDRMEKFRRDNELDIIKSDLRRQHNNEESVALANYVQNALYTDVSKVHKRTANLGVKGALFFVLFGIEMPSILTEVSFISNPEEEKLLSTESYRLALANSIASGIKIYLSSLSPTQKIASSKPSAQKIAYSRKR
ncbi:MAG TPA: N-acetylmuramoyl-L-alanine amidase [Thermodesulfovibrionales bacterium]|nr:N-acetylmuramoyl-L-alanine amidase [Thermodesulfovibrionales bacterium]